MFETAYKTFAGVRDDNEDCIFVNGAVYSSGSGCVESEKCLLAVSDGVGGEAFGEEASLASCETLKKYIDAHFTDELAREYIKDVNDNLHERQKKDAAHSEMSATIAVLYIESNNIFAFNLGDSEIMRLRGKMLYNISEKHTLISETLKLGLEPQDSDKHMITKYLGGINFEPAIFDGEGTLDDDDIFIMFSDGVGDVMSKADLKKIMMSGISLEKMCEEICEEAMKKGSDDNISVILARKCRRQAMSADCTGMEIKSEYS